MLLVIQEYVACCVCCYPRAGGAVTQQTRSFSNLISLFFHTYFLFSNFAVSFLHCVKVRIALAGLTLSTSVLTCIVDGMDQAKYKCPRVRTRFSKTYTKLWRPLLHTAACWCHGSHMSFSVADADLMKNSSCQVEILSRELDRLLNIHGELPAGLVLQQDNTCREGKNQFTMAWMMLLVCLGIFRYTVSSYLRKGHRLLASISKCFLSPRHSDFILSWD